VHTVLDALIALVDDHLFPRLSTFLPDHHCFITGFTFPDDGGPPLVARTLSNCYASTNRSDTNANASFFSIYNTRRQSKTGCSNNQSGFHRSIPQ